MPIIEKHANRKIKYLIVLKYTKYPIPKNYRGSTYSVLVDTLCRSFSSSMLLNIVSRRVISLDCFTYIAYVFR